ncbi:patatin-like phospholipase family protein [Pokkaliibacter sp. CJK22405]|uniref:patatin-like phospholipase family protein n=1 Tax=Pokkaliibacter sp. CJK22405 TaxID=3384615 RepID=UPI0039850290
MSSIPPLSLGLQGGGAHGAFTWGVLDYLLEKETPLHALSGTSAGAMNAVMLAEGWRTNGSKGARELLTQFWNDVARASPFNAGEGGWESYLLPGSTLSMIRGVTRFLSPYQFNPFALNPLRDIVESLVDFSGIQQFRDIQLFVATTQANSGKLRLFRQQELTADALMASACLPTLNQAVEIDGEPYWDGGFAANPAIAPLIYEAHAKDILLILLSTLPLGESPRSADEIQRRVMDISFNSAFLAEMRMLIEARSRAKDSWLNVGKLERRLAGVRFHLIGPGNAFDELPEGSRIMANTQLFEDLFAAGRARGEDFWQHHKEQVGQCCSLDEHKLFG